MGSLYSDPRTRKEGGKNSQTWFLFSSQKDFDGGEASTPLRLVFRFPLLFPEKNWTFWTEEKDGCGKELDDPRGRQQDVPETLVPCINPFLLQDKFLTFTESHWRIFSGSKRLCEVWRKLCNDFNVFYVKKNIQCLFLNGIWR